MILLNRLGGGTISERVEVMDNGVIMFKQATQEDQGAYQCTAENDMGVITATATLLVDGNKHRGLKCREVSEFQ